MTVSELEVLVLDLTERIDILEGNPGSPTCSAELPHPGGLTFMRGASPKYLCQCGQVYIKDQKGGLMEVN